MKRLIDTAATLARFKGTGRTMSGYAVAHGYNIHTFRSKIKGQRVLMPEDIALLERDNLLVWLDEAGTGDQIQGTGNGEVLQAA